MKLTHKPIRQVEIPIILLAQFVIILYYLPYFILGENASILIHDNLDSNVTWIKILLDNNAAFSSPSKIIEQVLNGIPLSSVYGTYDISLVVFQIFGMYFGYVVNKLLISFIGFWGMYLLLRKHFLPSSNSDIQYITVGVSLIFALLPFWSFSAHVLGLPFVLFAFLNLRRNNKKIFNYLIIILFAFYSSLVLSGIFFLIIMLFVFVHDIIKNQKINWAFFWGLACLSIAYFISTAPIIYSSLFQDIESHRIEIYREPIRFKPAVYNTINIFLKGQYHAHSLHTLFVIPIIIILIVGHKSFNKVVKLMFAFIVLTSLFYGFIEFHLLKPIIDQITSVIPIQLQRFHFLHPMFWYILLAVALSWLSNKIKYSRIVIYSTLVIQLAFVIMHHEAWLNRKNPSYKDFYSEDTFKSIKKLIDRPVDSYKVISIGIHPAVAQYNGFSTLDGYFTSYPLKYKHEFRKVIENELNRDEALKKYFDNWGSRCYAFSSELGSDFISNKKDSIIHLEYDFQHLKNMGGEYIFSSAPINESLNKDIKQVEFINLSNNYWNIYLYKIK
ncbi:MAG: hypothetical protein GX259_10010 [Bacteroidales bacterium]|nr:hypothetical protein [Bacteroidales bacterium]